MKGTIAMELTNFEPMNYDYIIVGQGLAGTVLHYTLEKAGLNVLVIADEEKNMSSKVAAGIYNPVTGKRTIKTWLADDLFPYLKSFYKELEVELGQRFLHERPIYKPFADVADQNDVAGKSATEAYQDYISIDWEGKKYAPYIYCDNGGIEINKGGYLATELFLEAYKNRLLEKGKLVCDTIEPVNFTDKEFFEYNGYTAKGVIFCEGHRATKNPLFSWLPFSLTKGEVMELNIEDFTEEQIFNKNGFLFANESGHYLAGSTYELQVDKLPSAKGKKQIEDKLKVLLKKNYKVIAHRAGIRPTVKDRRPIIGRHPEEEQVYIFNGLGTKGVSLAPYFATKFCNYLLKGEELPGEVNISRYFSLYFEGKSAN